MCKFNETGIPLVSNIKRIKRRTLVIIWKMCQPIIIEICSNAVGNFKPPQ